MACYAQIKRFLMDTYPSLFPDECDVLEHLFFVNGNGYDWEEGALCEVGSNIDNFAGLLKRQRQRDLDRAQQALAQELNSYGDDTPSAKYYREEVRFAKMAPVEQRRYVRAARIAREAGGLGALAASI